MKTVIHTPRVKQLSRFFFSAASLMAGILVAVLIQAVLSSVYDNL